MKRKPNYLKHLLQWGVLLAIVATVLWAAFDDRPVDVEKYCPFGGLQAFGTYLVNDSLACSMSMLQIMMGLVLAAGVVLFSKLFCGYLCPLGTVGEWMGKTGRKMHLQTDVRPGGFWDRALRIVKYALLFTILYFTLSSSELFCKKLDPYYALATGFKGEIVLWMSLTGVVLLFLGSFAVRMFWCRYICPLGAVSNIFRFTPVFVAAGFLCWGLSALGFEGAWVWVIAATCAVCYIVEIVKLRSCYFPLLVVERNNVECNNCGLCEKKCPYRIPIHGFTKVRHVDCTLCGQCISSCNSGALQVNGKRSLRWLPGILAVVLFFAAVWMGSSFELPTIDEKWGEYERIEHPQTYEMEGLTTIKCFGSSKAFSAKMQTVPGVYGVKTFVRRHGIEVLYDPARTDTLKIQEAIFTPTRRKYATPGGKVPELRVLALGVEGLRDRMDLVYFGMVLQRIEGVYGFTAEFACPVDVKVYADPAAGITRERLREAIDAEEFILKVKDGEKIVPLHFVFRSFAEAGTVSREEFVRVMFRDVEKLSGRFLDNMEKWGDDEQYPKGIYEMPFPSIEKIPVKAGFPYFKSFLSCTDGIVSVDFVLRDLVPTMRLGYVKSMWTDEKLWNEVFQAPVWTLRMSDGTFRESEPRLKFLQQGCTVEQEQER